jgi:nicotinamidase/pyrazinamidase
MTALIIVDFQNDFALPTGSLSVPDAEAILPVVNRLHQSAWDVVYLSADWHTPDHCSFQENNRGTTLYKPFKLPSGEEQIAWPRHCVANTDGAKFHDGLDRRATDIVVYKGFNPKREAYSAFAGRCNLPGILGTPLGDSLINRRISEVTVCGLATDYCVKATAIDAAKNGFKTTVVMAACRGVAADSTAAAIREMEEEGVVMA